MPSSALRRLVLPLFAAITLAAPGPGSGAVYRTFLNAFEFRNLGPFRTSAWITDFAVPENSASGSHPDFLCGDSKRRCLEDGQQRHHLRAHLRQRGPTNHRDRCCGPPQRRHRLGRHRRSGPGPLCLPRRRGLQVHRRGKTWEHMGLEETHHVRKIIVPSRRTPTPCTSRPWGTSTGPTRSGAFSKPPTAGRPGKRSSTSNERIGVIDLVMVPDQPEVLYAATYEKERYPWHYEGGGARKRHPQNPPMGELLDPA